MTRFPVPSSVSTADIARAVPWFPVTGGLVGGLAGLAGWWARGAIGDFPSAFLTVAIGLLITGALHEDGLADTFDGLGAGGGRSAILEVMQDSRVGVYGVAALILAIGLKASLLMTLPDDRFVLVAAVAAAVSRAWAVTMMKVFPPAKESGLVADLSTSLSSTRALIAALVGAGAAALLGWPQALAALVGWTAALLIGLWARRRIGGLTGDVVGAMVVVSELGVLTLA